MGTIPEKLDYLLGTKNEIKKSIQNKGIAVADEDKFRDYATKIDSITVSKTQEKTINITSNGTTNIVPDTGYNGISKVAVTTNINTVNNQEKSQTITSNGTTTITPDSGKTGLSKVTINTNVARDAIQYGIQGTITKLFEGSAANVALNKSGRFTIPANKNCCVFIFGVTTGSYSKSVKVNGTAVKEVNLCYPTGSLAGRQIAMGGAKFWISKSTAARTCDVTFSASNECIACCCFYVI